ncbi:hypothetical protein, partial [Serratia marcescens]|uniref:hypothetical protein n=1 Tax=Serratia marcescens TaxID=615 RepID=UPI001BD2888B
STIFLTSTRNTCISCIWFAECRHAVPRGGIFLPRFLHHSADDAVGMADKQKQRFMSKGLVRDNVSKNQDVFKRECWSG